MSNRNSHHGSPTRQGGHFQPHQNITAKPSASHNNPRPNQAQDMQRDQRNNATWQRQQHAARHTSAPNQPTGNNR